MKIPKQMFIEDLSSEQIEAIENRMRPSQSSYVGFLGQNESLKEVIETDNKTLEKLGITYKQVADRLDSLMGQAIRFEKVSEESGGNCYKKIREGILIDGFLRVIPEQFRGSQECPFFNETVPSKDGEGTYYYTCGSGRYDFIVKNEKQGTAIKFPELMSHLVRAHHFFEGNTRYRLNPEETVKVLELEPNTDYTPITKTESIWKCNSSTWNVDGDFLGSQEIIRNADEEFRVAWRARAYIKGDKGVIVSKRNLNLRKPLKINDACLRSTYISRGQQLIKKIKYEYVVG